MAPATPQILVSACLPESHQRPHLLTIPRELRDMIIAPFLDSGDLIVLYICRTITEEALQRIKHEATFRVNSGIEGRKDTVLERTSIPAGLQNVAIHFYLPPGRDNGLENAFQSSSIRHLGYRDDGAMNRCTITIDYHGGESLEILDERTKLKEIRPRGPQLLPMLSYALSGYTHFNLVVISVVRGPLVNYWKSSTSQRLSIAASDAEVLKKRLEPALGPATFVNNSGICHLEFHPREYCSGREIPPIEVNVTTTQCRPWYPQCTTKWW